ncbi:hypothetical protein HMPREF3203_01208 [Proteus mirabilis]|nr:hypothetical protein HMPREF3203_01208 [Proteus mirabilis]
MLSTSRFFIPILINISALSFARVFMKPAYWIIVVFIFLYYKSI